MQSPSGPGLLLAHPLNPGRSIKLDAEINYYRKLLDGEYVRLSMPGSPSSTTKKLLKRTAAEVGLKQRGKRVFAMLHTSRAPIVYVTPGPQSQSFLIPSFSLHPT
jgi:hypothetical protein